MRIGYCRTSTVEQKAGYEAQLQELKTTGKCEEIFGEQVSSVGDRAQLDAALAFVRKGDTLVVTKLDRLARSVIDFMTIFKGLEKKDVKLHIMNLGMDTNTPTGKLMLSVLSGVAQFEREIMLERQRDGIAKAKADGKYKGRKPLSDDKRSDVIKLAGEGVTRDGIAQQVGIGIASVYRILAGQKERR